VKPQFGGDLLRCKPVAFAKRRLHGPHYAWEDGQGPVRLRAVPTFAKGSVSSLPARHLTRAEEHAAHARILGQVAAETGGDMREERKRRHAHTPVDAVGLRGVPCHAKGPASSAIRGTDPVAALMAKQPR
jgi:hypothetical protein